MQLGINKRAIVPVFLVIFYSMAAGQPGKNHKYVFDSDLQDNSVVSSDHSLLINYSVPELYLENITNDNGTFYKVAIPGHTPASEPGKPELPVLSRIISVPEGSSYKIRISDIKTSLISTGRRNKRAPETKAPIQN
jgi:hypothetical protein